MGDTITLETARPEWDAFSALQDSRSKKPEVDRALIAKLVRDQETMVRTLRSAGFQVVEGAPTSLFPSHFR